LNRNHATPHECTEALIAAEGNRMPMTVWDPCCGNGDISVVLTGTGRQVTSGHGRANYPPSSIASASGLSILRKSTPPIPNLRWTMSVVTNPPFGLAEAILRHAAAIDIEYLVFLHKAHWLNAQARAVMVETVWCPARCWLLTWRPDFKGQGAPTMDCSWFVFERSSCGNVL
jgi:hypothetical protein